MLWLAKTNKTSAKFELQLNDPDGIYRFQVRATNDQGVTGPYLPEGEEQMIVDRFEPFMKPWAMIPLIASE